MGLLHLLVAALAASAAVAEDCLCVNTDQKIDPISNPMIFFQNPTIGGKSNGVKCTPTPPSCTFTARLDDNADKNSTLQIQLLTNKLGDGSLTVDGMSESVIITSNTPPGVLAPKSYDTSITINFSESATNVGEFMLVVNKVMGRPEPPVVKVTTQAPVTAPYDPKFTHNPRLVANDIMIAIDMSSDNVEKYKTFAQKLIKEMAINPKPVDGKVPEDCGAGSRLSIVGLSAVSGFDNVYAPYWTTSDVQADGNIGSIFHIGDGKFFLEPVADNYIYGFDQPKGETDRKNAYTNCTNRGKIFILATSSAPAKFDPIPADGGGVPFIDFLNLGVHQILVYSNMPGDDMKYYTHAKYEKAPENSNIWNFFELTGSDKDTENFFNSFLVDSKEPMTCQPTSTNNKVDVVIGDKGVVNDVAVSIPPYYDAKTSTDGKWDTPRHYCNFQESTVRLIKDTTLSALKYPNGDPKPSPMCLTVYYDLETGKDFVSIFKGDPNQPALQEEVVRLTGRDISGTNFDLPDALGSIVFSSDEKNVYDGVHVEIKAGPC